MARPTWGVDPVSWNDIQTEFGGTNPIGLSEYYNFGDWSSTGELRAKTFYEPSTLPPPPQPYRGITEELQYVVQATSSDFSTSAPLHPSGSTPIYTGDWQTSKTLTSTSYTTQNGATRYKWALPFGSNLMPTTNTSGNTSIINNGGMTFYIVLTPDHSQTGWARLWNYWNLASGASATTIPSSTSQYHGPLLFLNNSNNYFEVRRPSSTTQNGAPKTTPTHTSTTTGVLAVVVVLRSDGTGKYWARETGGAVSYNASNLAFSSTPAYGIKAGDNSGRPVIVDSSYWAQPNFTAFMEAGFFNAPVSDTDAQTLVENLEDDYC